MVDYYIYHNYIYTYIYTYIYIVIQNLQQPRQQCLVKKHFWRIGGANPQTEFFLCFGFWMVRANRDVLSGMGFSQFRRCGGDFRRMKNA